MERNRNVGRHTVLTKAAEYCGLLSGANPEKGRLCSDCDQCYQVGQINILWRAGKHGEQPGKLYY